MNSWTHWWCYEPFTYRKRGYRERERDEIQVNLWNKFSVFTDRLWVVARCWKSAKSKHTRQRRRRPSTTMSNAEQNRKWFSHIQIRNFGGGTRLNELYLSLKSTKSFFSHIRDETRLLRSEKSSLFCAVDFLSYVFFSVVVIFLFKYEIIFKKIWKREEFFSRHNEAARRRVATTSTT